MSVMIKYAQVILLIMWLIAVGCGNNLPVETLKTEVNKEDFDSFFKQFHNDSLFQLSRIIWPLQGFSSDLHFNSEESMINARTNKAGDKINTTWNKEKWQMHRMLEDTATFKVDRRKSDSLVMEKIYIPDSDLAIVRKFQLINRNWFLVYYAE